MNITMASSPGFTLPQATPPFTEAVTEVVTKGAFAIPPNSERKQVIKVGVNEEVTVTHVTGDSVFTCRARKRQINLKSSIFNQC